MSEIRSDISLYWQQVKKELSQIPLDFSRKKINYPMNEVAVHTIQFQSLYNETIFGYLVLPKEKSNIPIVIDYLGYMNAIQEPFHFVHWTMVGCGCLVIDNRDQGGRTKDAYPYETTNHELPFGRGILKKEDFYAKRLLADSLRAVEVVKKLPEINQQRVILRGGSQGGGIALFINALTDFPIFATFADVPSQSNISHRIEKKTGSYHVIQEYIEQFPEKKEEILKAMAYFDLKNVATAITGPVFTSVGSKDPICPMEDFFVSYKRIPVAKELLVYLNKGHGGGEGKQIRREMAMIQKLLQRS